MRNVIIDECCPPGLVIYLRERGMNAMRLRRGLPDYKIMRMAEWHNAYIVTADKDFRDCPDAIYVEPSRAYHRVHSMLRILMECEEKAKKIYKGDGRGYAILPGVLHKK